MKKLLAVALIVAVGVSVLPAAALAGDPHAVRNRWTGAAIGAATVVAGGLLLGALLSPVPAVAAPVAPPPVVYQAPPPVVYQAPPPVVYQAPPVVYVHPTLPPHPPVVIYRTPPRVVYKQVPPGHWKRYSDHGRWYGHRR